MYVRIQQHSFMSYLLQYISIPSFFHIPYSLVITFMFIHKKRCIYFENRLANTFCHILPLKNRTAAPTVYRYYTWSCCLSIIVWLAVQPFLKRFGSRFCLKRKPTEPTHEADRPQWDINTYKLDFSLKLNNPQKHTFAHTHTHMQEWRLSCSTPSDLVPVLLLLHLSVSDQVYFSNLFQGCSSLFHPRAQWSSWKSQHRRAVITQVSCLHQAEPINKYPWPLPH